MAPFDPHQADPKTIERFGSALDRLRASIQADMGESDLRHIRSTLALSRGLEVVGRLCLHFGWGPVSFLLGVGCLSVHKSMELLELGHPIEHGAFDRIEGAERFRAERWRWRAPIHEASWRAGHNRKHHQYTNIAGKDPDIHLGPTRIDTHTPYWWWVQTTVPFAVLVQYPLFAWMMSFHVTGMLDYWVGNGRGDFDVIEDRSVQTAWKVHRRYWGKGLAYAAYEFVLWPLLAWSAWVRVLAGNVLSDVLRDLVAGAVIYCGHIGP